MPQSCHATNPRSLNIHIVCHTHLDTGWTETYDEYYHRCEFPDLESARSALPLSSELLTAASLTLLSSGSKQMHYHRCCCLSHAHAHPDPDTDVKIIYDSVISTLSERPDRKFIVVEVSFFSRWFNEQDDAVRRRVHWLVESGT